MTDRKAAYERRRVLASLVTLSAGGLAGCPTDGTIGTDASEDGAGDEDADGRDGGTTAQSGTPTIEPLDATGERLECGATLAYRGDGGITEDTVLQRDCTYTLPERLAVSDGATLWIEPGAVVEAASGSGIQIRVNDGALAARGTVENPVVFRAADAASGPWGGITFKTDEPTNELTNVRIEDSGAAFWEAAVNVSRQDPAQLRVRNCTVTGSPAAGFRLSRDGQATTFAGVHVENTDGPPIRAHPERVGDLPGTTTFENVGESYVLVGTSGGAGHDTVTTDATWRTLNLPYRVRKATSIEASVEIEPGTSVEFTEGTRVWVQNGGTIVANGQRENGDVERIEFVGVEDTQGAWDGIVVDTDEADNEFGHVLLSDAGGGYWDANLAIGVDATGRVSVHDSEISDSAAWGIHVGDGTLEAENNTFANNAEGAIQGADE